MRIAKTRWLPKHEKKVASVKTPTIAHAQGWMS